MSLIKWWQPRVALGSVVTDERRISEYINAAIHLNDRTANLGGLVSAEKNVFIVSVTDTTIDLRCCLWQPETSRCEAFRKLRGWVALNGFDVAARTTGEDRELWELSDFDM